MDRAVDAASDSIVFEAEASWLLRLPNETILHILTLLLRNIRLPPRPKQISYYPESIEEHWSYANTILEAEQEPLLLELASVSLTCKRLSLIAEDDSLWHFLCDRFRLCYLPPSFYETAKGVITVDDDEEPRSFKEIFKRHRRKGVQFVFKPPTPSIESGSPLPPSRFTFKTDGSAYDEVTLQFDGESIYSLPPECDSWAFVADYERDRRKKPNTVGEILRDGDSGSSKVLSPEFLTHVGSFFPLVDQHEVRVGYYRCFPTGCTRGVAPDFFSQEQRAYYSLDPNTSRRRQNSANYYRSAPLHYNLSLPNIHNQSSLDACFLASLYFPLQTWEMLNKERIDYYQMRMEGDPTYIPTVLTLGVIDCRANPWQYRKRRMNYFSKYNKLAVASHFIIDGHHKLDVAAMLHHPVNILSFFVVTPYNRSPEEWGDHLGHMMKQDKERFKRVMETLVGEHDPILPIPKYHMVEKLPKDPLDLPPLILTNIAKDTTLDWLLKRIKRRSWCENKDWESASEDTIYDIWLPCDVIEYQKAEGVEDDGIPRGYMWLSDVDAYRATLSENSQSRDFNATPVFPDLEGIAFPYIPRKNGPSSWDKYCEENGIAVGRMEEDMAEREENLAEAEAFRSSDEAEDDYGEVPVKRGAGESNKSSQAHKKISGGRRKGGVLFYNN